METAQTIILSIFATGFIGIIAWSLVTVIQHGKKISVIERSWTDFVHTIKCDIQAIKQDIEKLNTRLDIYMRTELDAIKDIVKGKKD